MDSKKALKAQGFQGFFGGGEGGIRTLEDRYIPLDTQGFF